MMHGYIFTRMIPLLKDYGIDLIPVSYTHLILKKVAYGGKGQEYCGQYPLILAFSTASNIPIIPQRKGTIPRIATAIFA